MGIHVIKYSLSPSFLHAGAGTAMLGKEAAMACTVAVEEVIVEHYNRHVSVCVCVLGKSS